MVRLLFIDTVTSLLKRLQITKGDFGELCAAYYLQKSELIIISQKERYAGVEVDILARRGDSLFLYEVKTSRGKSSYKSVHNINNLKTLRLELALQAISQQFQTDNVYFRCIYVEIQNSELTIEFFSI